MRESNLISIRFKELREKNKFTQGQIAKYLDLDQSYISKFEKGERNLSTEILEKICDLFGCTLECFENTETEYKMMNISFRANELDNEDLEAIAAINKVALNIRFMNSMLEE